MNNPPSPSYTDSVEYLNFTDADIIQTISPLFNSFCDANPQISGLRDNDDKCAQLVYEKLDQTIDQENNEVEKIFERNQQSLESLIDSKEDSLQKSSSSHE